MADDKFVFDQIPANEMMTEKEIEWSQKASGSEKKELFDHLEKVNSFPRLAILASHIDEMAEADQARFFDALIFKKRKEGMEQGEDFIGEVGSYEERREAVDRIIDQNFRLKSEEELSEQTIKELLETADKYAPSYHRKLSMRYGSFMDDPEVARALRENDIFDELREIEYKGSPDEIRRLEKQKKELKRKQKNKKEFLEDLKQDDPNNIFKSVRDEAKRIEDQISQLDAKLDHHKECQALFGSLQTQYVYDRHFHNTSENFQRAVTSGRFKDIVKGSLKSGSKFRVGLAGAGLVAAATFTGGAAVIPTAASFTRQLLKNDTVNEKLQGFANKMTDIAEKFGLSGEMINKTTAVAKSLLNDKRVSLSLAIAGIGLGAYASFEALGHFNSDAKDMISDAANNVAGSIHDRHVEEFVATKEIISDFTIGTPFDSVDVTGYSEAMASTTEVESAATYTPEVDMPGDSSEGISPETPDSALPSDSQQTINGESETPSHPTDGLAEAAAPAESVEVTITSNGDGPGSVWGALKEQGLSDTEVQTRVLDVMAHNGVDQATAIPEGTTIEIPPEVLSSSHEGVAYVPGDGPESGMAASGGETPTVAPSESQFPEATAQVGPQSMIGEPVEVAPSEASTGHDSTASVNSSSELGGDTSHSTSADGQVANEGWQNTVQGVAHSADAIENHESGAGNADAFISACNGTSEVSAASQDEINKLSALAHEGNHELDESLRGDTSPAMR